MLQATSLLTTGGSVLVLREGWGGALLSYAQCCLPLMVHETSDGVNIIGENKCCS